jgi:hypothetical protein
MGERYLKELKQHEIYRKIPIEFLQPPVIKMRSGDDIIWKQIPK